MAESLTQEIADESSFLKLQCLHGDGKLRNVFLKKAQNTGYTYYICTICSVAVNPKRNNSDDLISLIKGHLESKNHRSKLQMIDEIENKSKLTDLESKSNEQSSDEEIFDENPPMTTNLVMENILKLPETFLGLEYIVEFLNSELMCYLCDKRFTSLKVKSHLNSKKHQEKYLSSHFATVTNFLKDFESRGKKNFLKKHVVTEVMKEVILKIKERYRVVHPTHLCQSIENAKHKDIKQWIQRQNHIEERDCQEVTDLLDEKRLKACLLECVEEIFPASNCNTPSTPSVYHECVQSTFQDVSEASDNEDSQELTEADIQILLGNFQNLQPQEQQRLTEYLQNELGKFDSLRKILSVEEAGNLEKALNGV